MGRSGTGPLAINIILNFVFIQFWGFAGLAAATSAAGLSNLLLLLYNLRNKVAGIDFIHILIQGVKIVFGSMAALILIKLIRIEILISPGNLLGKILIVGVQAAGMGLLYLVFARLLRVEEVRRVLALAGLKKK